MPEIVLQNIFKDSNLINILLAVKKGCKNCNEGGVVHVRIPIKSKVITPNTLTRFIVRPTICGCARYMGKQQLTAEQFEAINEQIDKHNEGQDAEDRLPA